MKPTDSPLMRLDLSVGFSPDGLHAQISDPVLGQVQPIAAEELALVQLFDGRRKLAQLLALPGVDKNALRRLLTTLERAHLLQTPQSARLVAAAALCRRMATPARRPMFRVVDASSLAELPIRSEPTQRHDCRHSGHCCRLGAVVLDQRQRDAACSHHWGETLPRTPTLQRVPNPRSANPLFLVDQDSDGRCGFLQTDQRCAIHSQLGVSLKPSPCRLFPLDLVHDDDALLLVLHQECASYDQSYANGTPLSAREQSVREILRDNPALQLRALPTTVRLRCAPETSVAMAAYRQFETTVLDALRSRSLSDVLRTVVPAALAEIDPTGTPAPTQDAATAGVTATLTALGDLAEAQQRLAEAGIGEIKNLRFRHPAFAVRAIARLRRQIATQGVAIDDALFSAADQAYLRQYGINFLWSKTLFYYPSLEHGVAAWRLTLALSVVSREIWGSRDDASSDPARHVHQSLTYWATLFRFPEFQHLLGGVATDHASAIARFS